MFEHITVPQAAALFVCLGGIESSGQTQPSGNTSEVLKKTVLHFV